MSRKLLIAGNWKLHLTVEESLALAREVAQGALETPADLLLCPTFPALYPVARALENSPVMVGAQNLYWEDQGAYTGEVSGPLLKAAGASHVIVGHSERRQFFGETETTVNRRLRAALAADLTPILCIGETLEQREAGQTEGVLESQLAGAMAGLTPESARRLIIAYEPVWAIGTGRTASPQQADQAHAFIRGWLADHYDKGLANSCRILYGGSVKPANAAGLLGQAHIDGALVGGASLKAADFLGIVRAATQAGPQP